MELLANLALGFQTALSFENLIYCFIGTLIGTFIGVLPGIGPMATLAMLLPLTYHLPPVAALIMLAGIYYGSQYGGSTTAILMNLPGEVSSSVTALDGYAMARKGKAGVALAIAAIGSFVAGTIATLLIAVFAIPLTSLAIRFGSAEYFSLIVLGFIMAITLARGSVLKALAMILTGILFGMIGTDVYTGAYRFTLGSIELVDGMSTVAVALGIFGIAEVLRNLEKARAAERTTAEITSLMPSRKELRESAAPILRGTAIGSILGILPGSGALLSAFTSYAVEKRLSKHPEEFGQGALAGVAGPESANNAGAQASYVPLLTLGIPSTPAMALMVGAMMIHGIVPGPRVAVEQPALFWGLIASMWIGNAMLVVLNLPLVGLWVSLLKIPYAVLFPSIVAFAAVGVFTLENNAADVLLLTGFALFGYFMAKLDCEPAPFLLGLVLGPLLEEHFRRAMLYSNGDLTTFVTQPISAGLMTFAAVVVVVLALPAIRGRRDKIFEDDSND